MTQQDAVLKLFLKGQKLTQDKAKDLTGTTRLGAIVFTLKELGFAFDRKRIPHETRFKTKGTHMEYSLNRNLTNKMTLKLWETKLGIR